MAETIHIDDTRSHYALKATLKNGSVLLEGGREGSAKLSVDMEQLCALAPFMASTPEGRAKMREALDGIREPGDGWGAYENARQDRERLDKEVGILREQVRQGQLRIVDLQEQLEAVTAHGVKLATAVTRAFGTTSDTTRDAPMQPASAELVRKVVDEALAAAGCECRVMYEPGEAHAAGAGGSMARVVTLSSVGAWLVAAGSLWSLTESAGRIAAWEASAIPDEDMSKKTDAELTFGMLGVPR